MLESQSTIGLKTYLWGKSLKEVDQTIKNFIKTLANPISIPLAQALEKISLEGEHSKEAVSIVTKIIIEKLNSFQKELGLTKHDNFYKSEVLFAGKNHTWIEDIIQNILIILQEVFNVGNAVCEEGFGFISGSKASYTSFVEKLLPSKKFTNSRFNIITLADEFLIYVDCIPHRSIKDIMKAIEYGSIHSTDEVFYFLKGNIQKPHSCSSHNITQCICFALENIIPGGKENCITNWENLQTCFLSRTSDKGGNLKSSLKNHEFLKTFNIFLPSWVQKILNLDRSCKMKNNHEFECRFKGKRPEHTKEQIRFIIEFVTGKPVTYVSALSKVIDKFSNSILKNKWARTLIKDCAEFITIYKEGKRRKAALHKKSIGNPKELMEFKKISRTLDEFKKGVVEDLLTLIAESSKFSIRVEKSFSKVTPKAFGWEIPTSVLASLVVWFYSLFNTKMSKNSNFNNMDQDVIIYENNFKGIIAIEEG